MPLPNPQEKLVRIPLSGPLDQNSYPGRMAPGKFQTLQNLVYRRLQVVGKRSGSGPYGGSGAIPSGLPAISGTRWYRGLPTPFKTMIVQSADQLWQGNDTNGTFTPLSPALATGSGPAFFTSAYDPAVTSDILIVAYGSGPPFKYDGTTFSQLNASITASYDGAISWHNHVWLWGDDNNPDTVFATDLGTPESMTYVTAFGGYPIGRGDGDPLVQRCIPQGNALFVFKNESIYTITGYDFMTGEYQFSVQPFAFGVGIPSPNCVAQLPNGTLLFWSGQNFFAIPQGASAPVPIGSEVMLDMSLSATGNQAVVRCVAGDFVVSGPNGNIVYSGCFMCAVDDGSGTAQKVFMYDDTASSLFGEPAWTIHTGLRIGCFIPWLGPGDQNLLYFGDALSPQVNLFGQNAMNDSGAPINVVAKTIRDDTGTPEQRKRLPRLFLECESGQATFNIIVQSDLGFSGTQSVPTVAPPQGSTFGTAVFGTDIFGQLATTAYQVPLSFLEPELFGDNFTFTLLESSATSMYELVSLAAVYYEEALPSE